MARPNTRGRELSFHKPSKRWRKIIDGKAVYFGKGTSAWDRASYAQALSRYRAHMAERERRLSQPQRGEFDTAAKYLAVVHEAAAPQLLAEYNERMKRAKETDRLTAAVGENEQAADAVRAVIGGPKRQRPTVEAICDKFYAECERRQKLTEAQPDAVSKKQRMSRKQLVNYDQTISKVEEFVASVNRKTFGDVRQTETMLEQLRDAWSELVINESWATSTYNGHIQRLGTLMRFAASKRLVEALPMNLTEVCRKFDVKPNPKPLDLRVVKNLWRAADARTRCYMALGLNCAMYGSEIGTLKAEDIVTQNGKVYIASRRGKTGAPYKHLLWKKTIELIEQNRNGGGLLFTTRTGNSVSEYDAVGQTFRKLVQSLKPQDVTDELGIATFSRLRDTTSTMVERIGEREGNMALSSMLLAHADDRTAKYYVGRSPKQIDSSALDAALREVEAVFEERVFKL